MTNLTVMETFSKNTRAALAKRGWTIQRLATQINMDRSDLSKVIRGERGCTLETAVKISNALKVPLSALVDDFSEILVS